MASIMEGALWTVPEAVAERMVETGLLRRCKLEHVDILEADKPVYHISHDAPDWFGFGTIPSAIASATKHVEEAQDEPEEATASE